MKDEMALSRVMDDHEKRIVRLESLIAKAKRSTPAAGKRKLGDLILEMRDKGFFSQPKTALETHGELQQHYSCERNRVEVALFRLSDHRELRLTSKVVEGKKYKAYVW